MKNLVKIIGTTLILFFTSLISVNASTKTYYVNLNSLDYSTNQKDYESIKEYSSLEDFLVDYKSNSLPEVYITNFLFDGVSTVKSPDLDDFIESESNSTKIKTLEIKVININTIGDIAFTGEITGAMIAVNTNNKTGNINLILNNVNIDTDSKKAPAIYVYNKVKNYTDAIVTIKTTKGSENHIEGGKLKKVSLLGSDELDSYSSNYSGESLTNYQKYTSYYGIYTSEEIENILFATAKADSEDLSEGDPLYFYKASGAISSDIDLYFDGAGFLSVISKNKEGIETKGNLTFSGGTGEYEIYAGDDVLNTTTSSSSDKNARNDIVIDVKSLLAVVSEEADEGDAIDSNGKLTINGGNIYAFAHPTSQDAGLDSEKGTYINGGVVIATGNMVDQISSDSKQDFIYANLNSKISADTLIVIKDIKDDVVMAFKTSRDIKTLLYSDSKIDSSSYKLYSGGTIEGEETNGLYTKITDYTGGEEISFSNASNFMKSTNSFNISDVLLKALLIETGALIIMIVLYFINKKRKLNMQ